MTDEIRDHWSPNHDDRPAGQPVDMLILHYTGMRTAAEAIDRLCDVQAQVSSHYVVDEDGTVLRLVPEHRRAWHAGVSYWRGHQVLNGRSIGIEIVNPGHEWGYRDFPPGQMSAVRDLCRGILARHPIPARNVIGHSDVAPDRKEDPGERFRWDDLARDGIGLWPFGVIGADAGDADEEITVARAMLARLGYRVVADGPIDPALTTVVRAFQRHWRQETITGLPDKGTMARLRAVLALAEA